VFTSRRGVHGGDDLMLVATAAPLATLILL
jgi:hypothetical protein